MSATKASILLVEDSETDAFLFERVFRKAGISVSLQHVLDGAEAIEYIRHASISGSLPCVIFVDLKMPVLNGFDVLEWIRKQPYASQIQVVVLSGSEHEKDIRRAAELGAADYLVKPVTVSQIHRHLDAHCSPQGMERAVP